MNKEIYDYNTYQINYQRIGTTEPLLQHFLRKSNNFISIPCCQIYIGDLFERRYPYIPANYLYRIDRPAPQICNF